MTTPTAMTPAQTAQANMRRDLQRMVRYQVPRSPECAGPPCVKATLDDDVINYCAACLKDITRVLKDLNMNDPAAADYTRVLEQEATAGCPCDLCVRWRYHVYLNEEEDRP